ncbi:DUF4328 domain-containing protein [Streptomyces sp. NPDC058280]|uniref:DUF4328 domain-containing protein n=1 Tax=Streptomyces sp. NPDC058280 TaxID=3346419 RepID=UPI0036E8E8F7
MRAAVTADGLCDICATERARTGGTAGHLAPPAPAPASAPAYGYPAAPAVAPPQLASPVGLSRAVVVLLGAVIAADIFALAAGANVYGLMSDVLAEDFGAFTDADLDRADWLYAGSGVAQLVALLAAAVVFIIWFVRVRKNAGVFAPDRHRMGPGWAIGSWFVPFGNFWLPRRVAGDIWAASTQDEPDGSRRPVSYALVNAWWAAWVCTLLLGRYGSRMYDQAEEADAVREAAGVLFAADLVDVLAAVLAILFVRKLTRMQHLKATQGPLAPAPPL